MRGDQVFLRRKLAGQLGKKEEPKCFFYSSDGVGPNRQDFLRPYRPFRRILHAMHEISGSAADGRKCQRIVCRGVPRRKHILSVLSALATSSCAARQGHHPCPVESRNRRTPRLQGPAQGAMIRLADTNVVWLPPETFLSHPRQSVACFAS
jgi:hypothetical protein